MRAGWLKNVNQLANCKSQIVNNNRLLYTANASD
ncbi:MAG: hypothetical protein JWQ04_1625 [Pedosphaera sp.]|nr:hypothetical protein [Pedosphaera sp.]